MHPDRLRGGCYGLRRCLLFLLWSSLAGQGENLHTHPLLFSFSRFLSYQQLRRTLEQAQKLERSAFASLDGTSAAALLGFFGCPLAGEKAGNEEGHAAFGHALPIFRACRGGRSGRSARVELLGGLVRRRRAEPGETKRRLSATLGDLRNLGCF